jgi:hypothetical protein
VAPDVLSCFIHKVKLSLCLTVTADNTPTGALAIRVNRTEKKKSDTQSSVTHFFESQVQTPTPPLFSCRPTVALVTRQSVWHKSGGVAVDRWTVVRNLARYTAAGTL